MTTPRQALEDVHAIHQITSASPARVWSVLADGWTYPSWVVGAPRMRAVSPSWPEPGAELHHSFGMWPTMINDRTISVRAEPEHLLVIEAHGWPFGEATVSIVLTSKNGGTDISITEDATAGPGRWLIPSAVRQQLLRFRNREVLRRLAFVAERSPNDEAGQA